MDQAAVLLLGIVASHSCTVGNSIEHITSPSVFFNSTLNKEELKK